MKFDQSVIPIRKNNVLFIWLPEFLQVLIFKGRERLLTCPPAGLGAFLPGCRTKTHFLSLVSVPFSAFLMIDQHDLESTPSLAS